MGLTKSSTGLNANDKSNKLNISSDLLDNSNQVIVALAGNPNVGKSSIFNELTGLNQHTGNWAGKTVTNACGSFTYKNKTFILVDIPGTYSLYSHSKEEEVARNFICFSSSNISIVVCDASALERNLNLVLQVIEVCPKTLVCINLIDEAEKKGISVNADLLENLLGVPVVLTSAVKKIGLESLKSKLYDLAFTSKYKAKPIRYSRLTEIAISIVEEPLLEKIGTKYNTKWIALKLMENDTDLITSISDYISYDLSSDKDLTKAVFTADNLILKATNKTSSDLIISQLIKKAEAIKKVIVKTTDKNYNNRQYKIDKFLTGKFTGTLSMLVLLGFVFWLTIKGANYPSQLLSTLLFGFEDKLYQLLSYLNLPEFLLNLLVFGVYRVVAWIVSVMLPPMAIFFPLFTLLEDLGYLPRIAFNLDRCFKKCCACGKQSLTMAMGFGCNSAGVVGCRIIDSPRERLIAIITNSLVPCNGRFPTLIAIITMFFAGCFVEPLQSIFSALLLTAVILFGILMTFLASKFLSKTILKGIPSTFTLELPPYRKPQILKLIIRSIFDRTIFVLARALVVAAPSGAIIFLLANFELNGIPLLTIVSNFLDPLAKLIGLDGVILVAFILGFPANEIVLPIILMAYLSTGTLRQYGSLNELKTILIDNGWTWLTALCTMIFCLLHWPCSTTCLTIKKETKSLKWTLVSFLLPTLMGITICFVITSISRLFGLV